MLDILHIFIVQNYISIYEDWLISFVEEIRDYEKLEKIGNGETEI